MHGTKPNITQTSLSSAFTEIFEVSVGSVAILPLKPGLANSEQEYVEDRPVCCHRDVAPPRLWLRLSESNERDLVRYISVRRRPYAPAS
jgi:hypothetical protein